MQMNAYIKNKIKNKQTKNNTCFEGNPVAQYS